MFEYTLDISETTGVIEGRKFNKLDWSNEYQPDLIFKNCVITDSKFSSADLKGLRLKNCQIFNCDFSETNISNGEFENTLFYNKESQKGCDFHSAKLCHSKFVCCDISTSNFYRSELFDITIDRCQAQGCHFELADFTKIVSRKVIFSSATLIKSNFKYSDFEGVYLKKCDLSGSNLVSVVLSRVNLEGANLTNTIFSPSRYDGMSIFKADLRNAEISNIDVRTLDFSGVEIFEWQMIPLMEEMGFIIHPDN
ncbi:MULTISPECIES: pentapeptide repeat-containing protein [Photorhabdus]|nr:MULTISPECIES: pentapeptide repeat-containing protein [Photorhabdus]EQC00144.1 putative low-complexity protein [Photorhabdus temperata subsp. temperata M1021]